MRDVLIELGREGKINLEIDPRIQGGIIFSAHQQPFDLVLRRICSLAGLRYKIDGNFIRVELDEPYQQNYPLDYLSLSRRSSSEVTIATNVFDVDVTGMNGSGSSSSSKSANDNNSVAKISGASDADFWSEVEKSLPQVMAQAKQHPTFVVKDKSEQNPTQESNFSLDRQAGLVTVFGNSKQHEAVQTYLERLNKKASEQVLIEARIVEVELADEFQSGVNWSSLFSDTLNVAANFGAPGAGAAMTAASSGLFTAGLDTGDLTGILNLVRTFGTTRVLSSPRLGRTVVAEVLTISPELDDMIEANTGRLALIKQARKEGFRSIQQDGIRRVLEHEIALEDLLRAVDMSRAHKDRDTP